MRRIFWIAIGFGCGALTCVGFWLFAYLWLLSPVRVVENVIGFSLPDGVDMIWRRDEGEPIFGNGMTLTIFSIPKEFAREIRAKCPPGFLSGAFEESGIPLSDLNIDGRSRACLFSKEGRDRTVVILTPRLWGDSGVGDDFFLISANPPYRQTELLRAKRPVGGTFNGPAVWLPDSKLLVIGYTGPFELSSRFVLDRSTGHTAELPRGYRGGESWGGTVKRPN
jgi:hypothetical protein